MPLADWLARKWVTKHQATREEIAELLALADRDLQQCQAQGLNADWRLAIAYNAALQCATAALAASGYRATREAHHYRVIYRGSCIIVMSPGLRCIPIIKNLVRKSVWHQQTSANAKHSIVAEVHHWLEDGGGANP